MKKSMLMILKRTMVTVIMAAFAFSLTACSGKEENQEAESRYVFSEKFSLAENRGITENGAYSVSNDNLYYITKGEYDDSLDMYPWYVNMCNLSDGTVAELFPVTPDDSKPENCDSVSASVEAIKAEDNGDITVIMYIRTYDDMGEDLGKALKKYTYSSEGNKKDVCDIEISGLGEDEDYSIKSCRLGKQGEIYVLFGGYEAGRIKLCKCNPDGTQAKNFEINALGMIVKDIILDSNDRPVVIYEEEQADSLYTAAAYIDMDKGAMGAKLDGIVNGEDDISRMFSVYSGGSDSTFLINDTNALSEYDDSTGSENVICNWMDCGVSGAYVIYAVKCGNGNIFCLYNDGHSQDDHEKVIAGFIEKTDMPADDIPVIRIASVGGSDLCRAVSKIIRDNDKYRVEYISYEQYDNSAEKLYYDIMAGNVPDMILMGYGSGIEVYNFIAKGFLEDLTSFIEKDSVLNEDYFLDGFLDAIKIDGKNYFLGNSFIIETLVGKKSDLAGYEDRWTVDDFIEYCRSKPEGTNVLPEATKQGMCFVLIGHNMTKFIDWNTGKCSFDGEEFKKLLEFCNRFKNGSMHFGFVEAEHKKQIQEGELLFEMGYIPSIHDISAYKTVFGDDETYIGYPSENDSGTYMNCTDMAAIFASSEHKEEAWDIIKALYTSEYSKEWEDSITPASKDGFERHFSLLSNQDGRGSINGVSVGPATKEDAETVKELLKKSKYRYYIFEQYEIIEEDINSYFEGEKGLDETVRVIQDRMEKYVNENM